LERDGLVFTVPAKGRFVRDESTLPPAEARAVATQLRAEFETSELKEGDLFASENEVSARFGISRYAARKALAELEAAGLLVSVHGRGRFVRRPQGS
jgi:DNA-binding GntR family transcriptional regulator